MRLFGPNIDRMKRQSDIPGLIRLLAHPDREIAGEAARA